MTDEQNQYVVFVYMEKVERSSEPFDVIVRKMNPDQIRNFTELLVKRASHSSRKVSGGQLFNTGCMEAG